MLNDFKSRVLGTFTMKRSVARDMIDSKDMLTLLNALSVKRGEVSFKPIINRVYSPLGAPGELEGGTISVQGYEMLVKIPDGKALFILQHTLCGRGNIMPFPAQVSFTRNGEPGGSYLRIVTLGDLANTAFPKSGEGKDAFVRLLQDPEKSIQYKVFKACVQVLAKAQVYQFVPQIEYMPSHIDVDLSQPGFIQSNIEALSRVYIGSNKEINSFLREELTVIDYVMLKDTFSREHERFIKNAPNMIISKQELEQFKPEFHR